MIWNQLRELRGERKEVLFLYNEMEKDRNHIGGSIHNAERLTLSNPNILHKVNASLPLINHLNSMWMQKTNEIHLQGQSAFQTAVSLCFCRRTEHQQSERLRVMAGPSGSQNSATPQSRQHQRSVGSEEKKNEKRGPRGSDSHIPQSPVYQGHTCPPSLPLPNASVHQSLTLPKCQGRDLGDSANSTPRLVGRGHKQRAEKGEKGREVERLRERGESGNWMVQYAKPILIGDCSAMSCFSWEYVKRRDRRVGRYGCFPRSWTAGLTTGAKLNSGLGHWKQIPGYRHHTRPPQDLLQSACN